MTLLTADEQLARSHARQAVADAIRDGLLRPTPCVVCWRIPAEGHHPRGYDDEHRLDVVWLCKWCHERIHEQPLVVGAEHDYRALRVAVRLGLRELERRTGINRGRLSIIERGVQPTPDEAKAILEALAEPDPEAAVAS